MHRRKDLKNKNLPKEERPGINKLKIASER